MGLHLLEDINNTSTDNHGTRIMTCCVSISSKSILHYRWTDKLPRCWVDMKATWSYHAVGYHDLLMIVSVMVSWLAFGARTLIASGISLVTPLPFYGFRPCQRLLVETIWVQSEIGWHTLAYIPLDAKEDVQARSTNTANLAWGESNGWRNLRANQMYLKNPDALYIFLNAKNWKGRQ